MDYDDNNNNNDDDDYLIVNFDHPSALETSLLIKHINQLKLGIYMRRCVVFNS